MNPYRTILRKQFSDPVIALLAFILGIWMWKHYFSPETQDVAGGEEVALLKIDRDLRLADAMAGDPDWLRRLAGAGTPSETRRLALEVFEKLEKRQAIGPAGAEAAMVVTAVEQRSEIPAFSDGADAGAGSWWFAKILEAKRDAGPWKAAYAASLRTLRGRAIGSAGVMSLLVLTGALFLPLTLRRLVAGLRKKTRGYAAAWTPALGLTVFMVSTLAWIGYVGALDFGIETVRMLPPVMGILLDTAARLLPSLIAIGFLFKQPRHVVRTLGLNRPIHLPIVLSLFSLLLLADRLLAFLHLNGGNEPGGSLSLTDAGIFGLIFSIVSACLVAPFAEEILYRGVLFRSLGNRFGVLAGAFFSAVIFSAIHFYGLYGFASVAIFGFACALLYRATGSLASAIVLHMIYNGMIKIPEWVFYHGKIEW